MHMLYQYVYIYMNIVIFCMVQSKLSNILAPVLTAQTHQSLFSASGSSLRFWYMSDRIHHFHPIPSSFETSLPLRMAASRASEAFRHCVYFRNL